MKILFKTIKTIFLLFFATLIGGVLFFSFTEAGLRAGIQYCSSYFPGHLQIKNVNGTLLTGFSLQEILYQDKQLTFTAKSLQFNWDPLKSLSGKLAINKIALTQTKIKINTPNPDFLIFNLNWLRYVSIQQFVVNQLSIQNTDAMLHFNGTLTSTWNATWRIQIPRLHAFLPDCKGSFSSAGSITGPQLTPLINANFHADKLMVSKNKINKIEGKTLLNFQPNENSKFILTATDIKIKNTTLSKLDINANVQASHKSKALALNVDCLIAQKHRISSLLSLPEFTHLLDVTQPIAGKITFHSSQLDFLTASIPEIKSTRGILKGNFTLSGSLSQPHMTGEININDGRLVLPKFGITLDKIALRAENIIDPKIKYTGTFQSGNGKATVEGLIDLSDPDVPISLLLQGENLEAINLPEYKISAAPNLKLKLVNNELKIEGDILIPAAEITPNSFSNTVTLTKDVVFVEEHKKISALPFATTMQINLILGNKIHVAYKELQTHLRGKLLITQSPDSLATATGELHAVDGTYRTYGKVLTIQEGRLIFTNSQLTNPGLNIRASKQITTVTVSGTSSFEDNTGLKPISMGSELVTAGVQIIGTFEKPIVSLFSIPSGMSQTDILSYLILGHPQSQNSGKQTSALLSAVSAFNAGNTSKLSNITENIQNRLGLNELNVESTEVFNPDSGSSSPTTSLVVGKQLAPNLYVHYSMGLFDPIKILSLRYQLSKRFAIQSETSTMGNGADLLYGIERD